MPICRETRVSVHVHLNVHTRSHHPRFPHISAQAHSLTPVEEVVVVDDAAAEVVLTEHRDVVGEVVIGERAHEPADRRERVYGSDFPRPSVPQPFLPHHLRRKPE